MPEPLYCHIDYTPVPECKNEDVYVTCLQCNACGRFGKKKKAYPLGVCGIPKEVEHER